MSSRSWSVAGCAVLAVLALGACSDDTTDPSPATPVGAASPEPRLDCTALVPDDVVVALGWSPGDPAEEDAGRCLRRVDDAGAVRVEVRSESLQAACDRLRAADDSAGGVSEPVDWLEPTRDESCVSSLDVGTGAVELVFVNDTDEVVDVRIDARTSVTPAQLRAALGASADAARHDVDG